MVVELAVVDRAASWFRDCTRVSLTKAKISITAPCVSQYACLTPRPLTPRHSCSAKSFVFSPTPYNFGLESYFFFSGNIGCFSSSGFGAAGT